MADPVDKSREINPFWHPMLSGEFQTMRRGRQLFRMLSPTAQCSLPRLSGGVRRLHRAADARNAARALASKFAFLRELRRNLPGDTAAAPRSTSRCSMPTCAVRRKWPPACALPNSPPLMQRFSRPLTKIFLRSDAVVDKMVGDEVIGIYVPGLAGPDFRRRAVEAGLELLRATGHGERPIHGSRSASACTPGVAFVGSIGVEAAPMSSRRSATR